MNEFNTQQQDVNLDIPADLDRREVPGTQDVVLQALDADHPEQAVNVQTPEDVD